MLVLGRYLDLSINAIPSTFYLGIDTDTDTFLLQLQHSQTAFFSWKGTDTLQVSSIPAMIPAQH